MNLSTLLLRRRMMMAMTKLYRINWYPIIQGSITAQDMINELGDLFQTFDDAPDTQNGETKKGAVAFNKSTTSFVTGGNNTLGVNLRIYEEGYPPVNRFRVSGTYTFNSSTTAKHVVIYNSFGNNNGNSNLKWAICKDSVSGFFPPASLKYFHVEKDKSVNIPAAFKLGGYSTSIMYFPDWYRGYYGNSDNMATSCSSVRFSEGMSRNNGYYTWGARASDCNLKNVYCHWGLGNVPIAAKLSSGTIAMPFTLTNCKVHIPNLGNAEDNAALVAEYRSKGWNYVSGQGIFNDVETTEPQEQLN